MSIDRTPQLRELMQKLGINSLRELSRSTGISVHTINKLRLGTIDTIRWELIVKISQTFQLSIDEFTSIFGDCEPRSPDRSIEMLQQEYVQLQQQFQQQRQTLQSEFQFQSLQTLESFLTYFPTAKQAAIDNPDFPVTKILPLIGSIDKLLKAWGVTVIGDVGSHVKYDSRWHQLIEGIASPDQLVTVRYVGYRQDDKLIFRAKVSH
jgi:transcriptional regulator with XRE-family HTH domain